MLVIWSGAIVDFFLLIFNEVVLCLLRIWIHQSLKWLCDCFVQRFCWHCDWTSVGWTGRLQLLLPLVERAAQTHTASHLPVMVWRKSTLLIADLSLSWLSLLTLSAAPLCSRWYCNKPTAGSHLCMCVCVFEFHVLVKFSFWQQIEQNQVTHNCSLWEKIEKNAQRLECYSADDASLMMQSVQSHTTPKIPTPEPMAVSVGIISNFLACEAQITLH